MKYLLDTHTIIWYSENNPKISENIKKLISDSKNQIFISIASIWEMAIKLKINKLNLELPIEEFTEELRIRNFTFLPINIEHIVQTTKLDLNHKDPFDRIIISQAIIENMDLISRDDKFDNFLIDININRLW